MSQPKRKQVYSSRVPGTNPRTGEKLVPWEQVQKTDPATPPLKSGWLNVEVVNEDGPRFQRILVRAVEITEEAAKLAASKLGFIPTGNVKPA